MSEERPVPSPSDLTVKFVTQMEENVDEFMFKHLKQYCEGMSSVTGITHVPKQLLIRALTCFKEEHKEEYEFLMGRTENDDRTGT